MIRNIKKYGLVGMSVMLLAFSYGCNDWLGGLEKIGKMDPDRLLESEEGLQMVLASLYNSIPIEDFNYRPNGRGNENTDNDYIFNSNGLGGVGVGGFTAPAHFTDEATLSQGTGMGPGGAAYWVQAYQRNREVNIFVDNIAAALEHGIIDEVTHDRMVAESRFIRAYIYFQLAKRYGGVPIIDFAQDDNYFNEGVESLFIDRSTELATWNFVLDQLDLAIVDLPENVDSKVYISKWAGYALKQRVALYAASLAKYGGRVSFSGEAVTKGFVGIPETEASRFYGMAIEAGNAIISSGRFSLYRANPATPAEAAVNYQNLFMNPRDAYSTEVIFSREYLNGAETGINATGHDFDSRFWPNQAPAGFHKWGRYSVLLDIVDLYEDYTDDGTGASAPIVTRTDGNESAYIREVNPAAAQVTSIPFVAYTNPYDAFKNKDARLLASVVVPGSSWNKATPITIVMQGGMIDSNSGLYLYQDKSEEKNGLTYSSWGPISNASNEFIDPGKGSYSGFNLGNTPIGSHEDNVNFSTSGFSIRKFTSEDKINQGGFGKERSLTTPWIDFRLAEIYLNYAEAVVESGSGDAGAAMGYLNAIRHRAGHTDNIPLTLANVMKERRVELAFENHRMNDLFRRREYHTLFSNAARRHALVPMIDLRGAEATYVLLRVDFYYDIRGGGRTFQTNDYYYNIPGTANNRLTNNPGR